MEQTEILNLFKEFTSDGKKIKPDVASDWIYDFKLRHSDTYISLISNELNQKILNISAKDFLSKVRKEKIKIEGNKIIGSFAISSKKELEPEELFLKYESLIEELEAKEINKQDLEEGAEYELGDKRKAIYLGNKYIQTQNIKGEKFVLSKIKKAKLIYVENEVKEINSKDKFIKKVSERKSTKEIIENARKGNTKYVLIEDFYPEELNYIYKEIEEEGYFSKTKGLYIKYICENIEQIKHLESTKIRLKNNILVLFLNYSIKELNNLENLEFNEVINNNLNHEMLKFKFYYDTKEFNMIKIILKK
jgi:hypothetical protein